jgi:NitT/TauT family transport system substrate-binding protein
MNVTRSQFIALGAAPTAVPQIARAQGLTTIQVATLANDTSTASLYAARAGLFRRVGLDVDLQPVRSGAAATAAVAGGSLQLGFSSLVTLIEAHARGVPFTLIAPGGLYTSDIPYAVFIVRKDAPFKTAADLNGKTIATQALKDLNNVAMLAWMDQNGGDSKSLKFVELPLSASAAAIAEGRVDGANSGEPYLTTALEDGKIRTFTQIFDAIAKRFLIAAYFTTTEYATRNRDVVARFARAVHDASLYCNGHRADTVAMVSAFSGIDAKIVGKMARVRFADYLSTRDIQPLIDIAARYKTIEGTFDAQAMIWPDALKAPR